LVKTSGRASTAARRANAAGSVSLDSKAGELVASP
jgi:hypothetical protein